MSIWDCPISCTLRKPDLLYELDNIFVIFENDEYGHEQTTARILEIRSVLKKPLILFRINPNLKERPLLKKLKRGNGETVWEATKHFGKAFIEFKKIVELELEEFNEMCYQDDDSEEEEEELLNYVEIAFNYKKKDFPKDRGNIIKKDYGFKILV